MRLGFRRMHQIGKFHRILDEKYGDVISHQIPIALVRIKFDRKASRIAGRVGGTAFPKNGGKAYENGCTLSSFREQGSARIFRHRLVTFKITMCG